MRITFFLNLEQLNDYLERIYGTVPVGLTFDETIGTFDSTSVTFDADHNIQE